MLRGVIAHAVAPVDDFVLVARHLETKAHLLVAHGCYVGQPFLACTGKTGRSWSPTPAPLTCMQVAPRTGRTNWLSYDTRHVCHVLRCELIGLQSSCTHLAYLCMNLQGSGYLDKVCFLTTVL